MREQIKINTKKPSSTKENSAPHKQKTGFRSQSSHLDRILFLQRTIGNQAVEWLIKSGTLQAKLRIGQQGDKYKQEADQVADEVIWMPEPQVQRREAEEKEKLPSQPKTIAKTIAPIRALTHQRQDDEEGELKKKEEEELLQTNGCTGKIPEVAPDFEAHINAQRGGGQPLSAETRTFMESRFGYDFTDVRVHTDTQAAEALNARAFTMGKDVVFGAGQYSPWTTAGKRLIAHELTHVVQQGNQTNRVARFHFHYAERALEQEAVQVRRVATPRIQRCSMTPVSTRVGPLNPVDARADVNYVDNVTAGRYQMGSNRFEVDHVDGTTIRLDYTCLQRQIIQSPTGLMTFFS